MQRKDCTCTFVLWNKSDHGLKRLNQGFRWSCFWTSDSSQVSDVYVRVNRLIPVIVFCDIKWTPLVFSVLLVLLFHPLLSSSLYPSSSILFLSSALVGKGRYRYVLQSQSLLFLHGDSTPLSVFSPSPRHLNAPHVWILLLWVWTPPFGVHQGCFTTQMLLFFFFFPDRFIHHLSAMTASV